MYSFKGASWDGVVILDSKSFICWNCGEKIASQLAYYTNDGLGRRHSHIYICHHCNAPVIVDNANREVLAPLPGKEIKKLPRNINDVYEEVRKCMQSGSFTGAIMLMRKVIMNVAVHEGAKKNLGFAEYVDYLCENNIVPKKSKSKADSVRGLGNIANHEIETRTKEEAQNCFEFVELLLKVNYEFADGEGENGA